ncbi:MAG: RimK family alpha-L-glutamate ligase [Acidobacteriota bacterium]
MKIGILVGMENTFPEKLIEKINARQAGVTAEYLRVGGIGVTDGNSYRLIFDRISHEIPFYRSYLKHAALNGTIIVNNPFWWSADEKFFGYSLAAKLGLAVPKTVLLPQKSYKTGVTDASLRNLEYPLKWDEIIDHVGMPAILKPHDGGGWRDVYKVHSRDELWAAYDGTHTLAMVLQEFINFEEYVRCYCVGRKHVLVMPYDPHNRRYLPRHASMLTPDLEDRIIRDTILINEALGYDLNTVEFAMRDGIPYAIDFTNPAPDADIFSVTEPYFEWITDRVADLLIDYALNGEVTAKYHRWSKWLNHEIRPNQPEPSDRDARRVADLPTGIPQPVKSKLAGKSREGGKSAKSAKSEKSSGRGKKDESRKEKGVRKKDSKESKDSKSAPAAGRSGKERSKKRG